MKVSDKLVKVDLYFTVNMHDNGYMVEVCGRNYEDDYATAKIQVSSVEELNKLVEEITEMSRNE